jgi:hypothetical protein
MKTISAQIKIKCDNTSQKQLHSVENVFEKIDKKFIDFYGEYGRGIVNARREEWNKDDFVNLQKL